NGQTCSQGHCRPMCSDECALGDVRCDGNGVTTCGDLNFDGCLEWGPPTSCTTGTTCSMGVCSATCTSECTGSMCDGDVFRRCGNYDLDACNDLSPGTSCVPADPCQVGACTAAGCTSTPNVCNMPPPPTCVNASTLRTYDPSGTCATSVGCD